MNAFHLQPETMVMKMYPRYCSKSSCLFIISFLLLASSVAVAQQKAIPKPEETLGFPVGADFKLATYEQSLTYFQKLDEASDLIKLVHVGET